MKCLNSRFVISNAFVFLYCMYLSYTTRTLATHGIGKHEIKTSGLEISRCVHWPTLTNVSKDRSRFRKSRSICAKAHSATVCKMWILNVSLSSKVFQAIKHMQHCRSIAPIYTAWFKKMDSISYVYISWIIHGMWMIYITCERGGPKFSNTTARALA
jgi:hypothetical protein